MAPKIQNDDTDVTLLKAVTVQGHTYDLAAQAAIHRDGDGLNRGLMENPGLYAWWAVLEAAAKLRADTLEDDLEKIDARLYREFQAALSYVESNGKTVRATVEAIKANIVNHPERARIQHDMRQAQYEHALCKAATKALDRRQESLLAVASDMRAEMAAGLRDRQREYLERQASGTLRPTPPTPPRKRG
jgi:hypothetical protein